MVRRGIFRSISGRIPALRERLMKGTGGVRAVVGASALLIALAVALVIGLGRDPASPRVTFAGDLRRGGVLEQLRLPELQGGGEIAYADYAERPLVINFFASWCPTCIAEMPDLEAVHQRLGDEVAFLGVSQGDAPGASIELARETGITYETALDRQGEFFRAAGGLGMPTTIFVRPGGEIADIWVGPLDARSLRDLVAEHFGIDS